MEIFIFSPHMEPDATHARHYGPNFRGCRIARQIDEAKLTNNAKKFVSLMRNDLSGVFDGDDLVPRAIVKEQGIGILAAAKILGYPEKEAARLVATYLSVYDDDLGPKVGTRAYSCGGLYHASKLGELEAAINRIAASPGLYVQTRLHADPVQIADEPLYSNREIAAKAWEPMLKQHAPRLRAV